MTTEHTFKIYRALKRTNPKAARDYLVGSPRREEINYITSTPSAAPVVHEAVTEDVSNVQKG